MSLPSVNPHMYFKLTIMQKCLVALATYLWSPLYEFSYGLNEPYYVRKPHHIGCIYMVSPLYESSYMTYKIAIMCGNFVTLIALIWSLTNVNHHMTYKNGLFLGLSCNIGCTDLVSPQCESSYVL